MTDELGWVSFRAAAVRRFAVFDAARGPTPPPSVIATMARRSLSRRTILGTTAIGLASCALALLAGCGSDAPTVAGSGRVQVLLTDAPFPYDSVARVDVFVVRVDAKLTEADSSEAAARVEDADRDRSEWRTVAEPKRLIELTTLRDGVTTALGTTTIPAGSYRGFRLIIDPAQSSVTLKNGAVLTATSTPGIRFPSAGRTGIKVRLDRPLIVRADTTAAPAALTIDFSLDDSFVMRGNSLSQGGLLFKPGLKATVR